MMARFLRCGGSLASFIHTHSLAMDVVTIPALSDNYMYLLIDKGSKVGIKKCAAIDPVNPSSILEKVKSLGLELTMALTTHHHQDHAGGNEELARLWSATYEIPKEKFPIYGGDRRVQACNKMVTHDSTIEIGDGLLVKCLFTPCHTSGHICYHVTEIGGDARNAVFTGDTLFLGGCGRFFEGNASQMYNALVKTLGRLPPSTSVYCGHEYTLKNLQFALTIEPNNEAIRCRLEEVIKKCNKGQATVPGNLFEEMETNPFMRVDRQEVLEHCCTTDPIKAMEILREKKDRF
ncbi:unnamed protein product [Protopolystoma xenopodis]|uniref:hydroxyacylglutathione hydrolase n=1 Tax=Protopolystoma xenopodis TaxID=117903 RepID=A0A3S5BWK5_9PLAT|nr:unnamed protein product [Protopolystoma xenopodis]